MSEFDLLCNGSRAQPAVEHNRPPTNYQYVHATQSWLWLAMFMLAILGLQGCTHTLHNHKPEMDSTVSPLTADQADASSSRYLWERLRHSFMLPKPVSSAVARQATHIADSGLPQQVFARASPLLHLIMTEIQSRRLPMELVLLPFVESRFMPRAHSPVGADGPWQFMPATAREQGLAINRVHDDRRAWMKSTRAALDYLQKLHNRFGNWPIAMAAYNAGEGRVDRALQHHGRQSRFEDLSSLPLETRNYVEKIFAWEALLSSPKQYGVSLPKTPNAPQLEEVPITQDLDVTLAAELAGLSETHFRLFNPAFSGPLIPGATRPSLLLPSNAAYRFKLGLAKRCEQHQPLAKWSLKRLNQAATGAVLARQWRLDAKALLAANPLGAGRRYQAGSILFIPRRFAETTPNATEIRYATLSTEIIPPHTKTKKNRIENRKLKTKTIPVNYRSSQSLKASRAAHNLKKEHNYKRIASSRPLKPDSHCSSRLGRKSCKPTSGKVVVSKKINKVAALTKHQASPLKYTLK